MNRIDKILSRLTFLPGSPTPEQYKYISKSSANIGDSRVLDKLKHKHRNGTEKLEQPNIKVIGSGSTENEED